MISTKQKKAESKGTGYAGTFMSLVVYSGLKATPKRLWYKKLDASYISLDLFLCKFESTHKYTLFIYCLIFFFLN